MLVIRTLGAYNVATMKIYEWAVVGAGPAGIAAVGELLDQGVAQDNILWCDAHFQVGDFGRHWKFVTSNTNVDLFLQFLNNYQSFRYQEKPQPFPIDSLAKEDFCELRAVAAPLQWITDHLRHTVIAKQTIVQELCIENRAWQLVTKDETFAAHKVILAIGCDVKQLPPHEHVEAIDLKTALNPAALAEQCHVDDVIAVYGSSHSSLLIIRELVNIGVKEIVNFYLEPIRYAVKMDGWTLYDNTGLKAQTAAWAHHNVTQNALPNLKRYYSSQQNIAHHITRCNKAIYAIGFRPRELSVKHIDIKKYDNATGIIAPGLFGVGIAHPQITTSPLGHPELNVGLWKFMHDIRKVMPIWKKYGL